MSLELDPKKLVAHMLQVQFLNWWDREIGRLDLDEDGKADFDEVKEIALRLIREAEDMYEGANVRQISAAGASIAIGFRTLAQAVDKAKLFKAVYEMGADIQELTKLFRLFVEHEAKKRGVAPQELLGMHPDQRLAPASATASKAPATPSKGQAPKTKGK